MNRNNNNNNDDEGDAHGGDPGAYQGKATSSISVGMFKSGVDDFEIWVEYFEKAVWLATGARDANALEELYIHWLPLKLDSAANAVLKQARSVAWGPLKEELTTLSVDPQEKNISGKRRYPP